MASRWIMIVIYFVCVSETHASVDEDKELTTVEKNANQLFEDFWQWKLINNPQFATKVGIFKYDNRLTELSLSSYLRRADDVRTFLKRLRNISKGLKSEGNSVLALNLELLDEDLKQFLSGMKFKPYLWPLNNMEGPQNDYINLINTMKKKTLDELKNIISRLRLFSQQIDEIMELLREGMRLRLTLNRRSFEKLIVIYERIATESVPANPFFAPFKEKPKNITNKVWRTVVNDATKTIRNYIQPSFRKLEVFIRDEYLPNSRPRIGVASLPQGKDYYQAVLKYHTTTNLTPQQIHDIGLKEVVRITKRMDEVKRRVKYNGTLAEFRRYLRTDKKFGFKNEEDILGYYKEIEKKVKLLLPRYIGRQPTLPFIIAPVPKKLAPMAPFAYYNEPSPDGSRPGIFYINTYQPEKRRKYIAASLFLHEALPGHHTQIASKIEFGSPLLFRRYTGMDVLYYEAPACFARNSAYTEGWGLYCEYLGEEMGMYADPYDLFGRLSQEMLRAARLVVDTGMHALGWSRTKAINFMSANTAGNLHDIEAETDRYISWPGQACSYKIGELKIRELRTLAENKLGDKFEIRTFHDFLISMGNIPLDILEKQFKLHLEK